MRVFRRIRNVDSHLSKACYKQWVFPCTDIPRNWRFSRTGSFAFLSASLRNSRTASANNNINILSLILLTYERFPRVSETNLLTVLSTWQNFSEFEICSSSALTLTHFSARRRPCTQRGSCQTTEGTTLLTTLKLPTFLPKPYCQPPCDSVRTTASSTYHSKER